MSTNGVREVEKTLDRISKLPDAVLIQILSLLPTKDAVASCVLSKRWRYLCNSIDNFHFDGCSYYNNVENFVFLVDHVLSHCTCSKIKKFQLILPYNSEWNFDLSISRWMNFAVERKVEDVVLCLCDDNFTFELPISICTCSSLITLDWSCCAIDKESVIQWKSLKSLKLNYVFIDNDDLAKILSGCPALETLELSLFEGFRRLEITSSNLKRLSLGSYWWFYGRADEPLEIIAPYLQHLEISGDLDYLKCKLVNVSSLVTATLTFNITCITEIEGFADEDGCSDYHQGFRNLVLDYLQKLSYATELTIGRWFAEVVFMLRLEGDLYDLRCILFDVSSVVTAKLTFNVRCIKDILDDHCQEFDPHEDSCSYYHHFLKILIHTYLLAFRNANELTIGALFAEVLCMLQFQGIPLPELKCKYLTLELHEEKFSLYGVAGLLRASPHVETLNIDISTVALDTDISTDHVTSWNFLSSFYIHSFYEV
uniref:F-box family protein n=1 Tax=Solanum tuberosum TaxID=4113 RepID=M1DF72_SOLTU